MVGSSARRARRAALGAGTAIATVLLGVAVAAAPGAQAAGQGPCDLYASGGTPCVAAHSTTRALYGAYAGSLYQVRRARDNATTDVKPLVAGGVANAATQDAFCSGTTCLITIIYDQSGHGNQLTQAPPGGFSGPAAGGYDNLASATGAPTTLNGQRAYGVNVAAGTGYRNNATSGVAKGDQPEGMYAVLDGTHYNSGCCFDYGNAETNSRDNGNGTMEAIYFGTIKAWGYGTGNGPWVMADLENGLFSGVNAGYNAGDPTVNHRYLTTIVKGQPNHWAIRAGDAQSGNLSTFYDGVRPNVAGYNPMKKEGAIILGIGGDNSNGSAGTFYEGVMTSGYPSAATENAVQANVVAAGYGKGGAGAVLPAAGSRVSLQATTACCTGDYLQHAATGTTVGIAPVTSASSATDKGDATWVVRAGLADSACVSFEAANASGRYLRHQNFQLYLAAGDGTTLFAQDATFCPSGGNSGQGVSLASVNYTNRYVRHYNLIGYLASNGGSNAWDATTSWAQDTSWLVAAPWS